VWQKLGNVLSNDLEVRTKCFDINATRGLDFVGFCFEIVIKVLSVWHVCMLTTQALEKVDAAKNVAAKSVKIISATVNTTDAILGQIGEYCHSVVTKYIVLLDPKPKMVSTLSKQYWLEHSQNQAKNCETQERCSVLWSRWIIYVKLSFREHCIVFAVWSYMPLHCIVRLPLVFEPSSDLGLFLNCFSYRSQLPSSQHWNGAFSLITITARFCLFKFTLTRLPSQFVSKFSWNIESLGNEINIQSITSCGDWSVSGYLKFQCLLAITTGWFRHSRTVDIVYIAWNKTGLLQQVFLADTNWFDMINLSGITVITAITHLFYQAF